MIKHMKRCIFTKVKFMALFLFAALMAAWRRMCMSRSRILLQLRSRRFRKINCGYSELDIQVEKLTVNIVDAYDGKYYYYTIEAFAGNPAIDERARLLAGQKVNSKVPFNVNISIPDSENEIFIRQTDPLRKKSLCFSCSRW